MTNKDSYTDYHNESIQGCRVLGLSIAGIIIWALAGIVVRVAMLALGFIQPFNIEETVFGLLTREGAANFAGAYFAMIIARNHLNKRSRLLHGFILAVIFGTYLFGAMTLFLILPDVPFSVLDTFWYLIAGIGAMMGVWYGLHVEVN